MCRPGAWGRRSRQRRSRLANHFLPQDGGGTPSQQVQLGALLRSGQRDGFQIRVALIGSATDLGSVAALWHQPQNYARFLAQELSLVYRGPLLVLMPDGYGFYRLDRGPATEQSTLASFPTPGPNLATAALTAVQRLAAANGHDLPIPNAPAASPGSTDPVSWIAFAVGLALIMLAWTASLRARPLRAGG